MSTANPKKEATNGKPKKAAKKKAPKTAEIVGPLQREGERDVKARNREAYAAFIHWTICTDAERKKQGLPKTQGKFSELWGISEQGISEWKKRADFEKLRGEMFRKKLAAEVPEVMADMRKRIKKIGKADEVELWLAYSEGWDRKKVIEFKPPVQFSEGDVRLLIEKLPPDKQQKYYETIAKLLADARDADDEL